MQISTFLLYVHVIRNAYNDFFFLFQKELDPLYVYVVLINKVENTVESQCLLLKQTKNIPHVKGKNIIFLINFREMHQLMVGMGGPVGMPSTGIHASEIMDAGLNPT